MGSVETTASLAGDMMITLRLEYDPAGPDVDVEDILIDLVLGVIHRA